MKLALTPLQKKLALAGLVALFTFFGEVGSGLVTGNLNLTKAVLLGLAMGAVARIGGAVLAAVVTNRPEPPAPNIDTARR